MAARNHHACRVNARALADSRAHLGDLLVMQANEVGGDDEDLQLAARQVQRAGAQVVVDSSRRPFAPAEAAQVHTHWRGDDDSLRAGDQ